MRCSLRSIPGTIFVAGIVVGYITLLEVRGAVVRGLVWIDGLRKIIEAGDGP